MTASEENHQGFLAFENTIAVEFLAFHLDNPLVYELLVRFSRQVKQAGFNRYSMDAIYHRVRWHMNLRGSQQACALLWRGRPLGQLGSRYRIA